MTEQELLELRRDKWRCNGQAALTLDEVNRFIDGVGFCLMYPVRPMMLAPTFIGAYSGSDENLPESKHAFADPRAKDATELMVRALRQKIAFEANSFADSNFLISAAAFPFFYGLVGDRSPRTAPKLGSVSGYSPLALHAFLVIHKEGPITKNKLRQLLGGELSEAALDRALGELWARLRITRVDYNPEEGAYWDVLYRWAPDAVREGLNVSIPAAMTALISKYLEAVIACEPTEIEEFFSTFVSRARSREAINALLAARELQYVNVSGKTMLQVTPPRITSTPDHFRTRTPLRRGEPIARRPRTAPVRDAVKPFAKKEAGAAKERRFGKTPVAKPAKKAAAKPVAAPELKPLTPMPPEELS